ncbi:molecular chaperone [Pantoea sp. BAV 3049]|uniref:fimbrial biogenesis chaperone n=1 Tax=Pantoea sp. BAV 3049 TaxID=2654188 RepID=UPI00131DC9D5|nr:molecular chaperone [Pantoea sp. BAV 3049]
MRKFNIPFLFVLFFTVFSVNAGVVIGASRMIYDGNKKEKSISVENPDAYPYLMQSWVEDASGKMIKDNAPFIVTPPLFRLDSKQKNLLRIVKATNALPQDKETLFWLNIKSIPSKPDTDNNTLQIAVRSRLKLIYRPDALIGEIPEQYADKLVWKKQGTVLTVTNPSNYYINFMTVELNKSKVSEGGFVAPGSSTTFTLPANLSSGDLSWKIINDYGGIGAIHHANI